MPAKSAGKIVINLNAGTAQFLVDMDKANAKIGEVGGAARRAGSDFREMGQRGVSGMQATSATLRVLEGGLTNNLRAAERFTASVLGVGPILQAAFPVVGAIAFAGILVKLGEEVYKFFKTLEEAPEKMANAFRELNSPLRLTNDELAVSNERLRLSIAKLEGRTQNTLVLALAEARVAADKLADSLDKDLQNLTKLMKEQELGAFMAFVTGQAPTSGDTKQDEALQKQLRTIDYEGTAAVASAKTKEAAAAAQDEWNRKALAALDAELDKRRQALALAESLQKIHTNTATPQERENFRQANPGVGGRGGGLAPLSNSVPDQSGSIQEKQESITNLSRVRNSFALRTDDISLTQKDESLKASAENAKIDRPFEDRMKAMRAQLEGIRIEMQAIGEGEAAETLAKGFAAAEKEIEQVNKALERINPNLKLTTPADSQAKIRERAGVKPSFVGPVQDQESQLKSAAVDVTFAESDLKFRESLDKGDDAIKERILNLNLLTEAIGKGYEATKKAAVEAEVVRRVSPAKYFDETWNAKPENQATMQGIREQVGPVVDKEKESQTIKATESLTKQIALEKSLAAAQMLGAEAVKVATLANKLHEIALNGTKTATGELSDATRKQMLAEIALFAAQQSNTNAAEVSKITERTSEVKRLTAAIIEGAEAERKAALENKYGEMQRQGATPQVVTAQRGQDEAEHQQKVLAEALKTGLAYKDQLEKINQQIAALKALPQAEQQTLTIVTSLKNLENERLKTVLDQFVALKNLRDENLKLQAELSLKLGGAQDGVRAFFLEMQEQAKQTSVIIEEALNGALDRVSDNLAKLMTGQKTAWAKMFQSLGEEVLKSTVKSALQTGLGKLGADLGVGGKADGSSASKALWVRMASATGAAVQGVSDITKAAAKPEGGAAEKLPGPGGVAGLLQRMMGGNKPKGDVLMGNGGLLGTGGIPTVGGPTGKPDGTTSNPVGVTITPGGAGPDGSEGNPFYVVSAGAGFESGPTDFGSNQVKQSSGPNGLQTAGSYFPQVIGQGPQARAAGGPVKRGAEYLVGERGPEIVRFPKDGHVVDHETTKRILAAPQRYKARADGGDVSAGESYIVGERGAEGFMPNLAADQGSRRTEGNGGDNHYYTIDARGTDPNLVEQRVRQAIVQSHKSAITTSVQANVERSKRTPG